MRTLRLWLAGMAILVLLGGGATALAQEPSSPSDLLPGVDLVTEEIEAGVFRIASDGTRNLAWPVDLERAFPFSPPGEHYWRAARQPHIVGSDDGVWLGRPDGIIRIGDGGLVWPAGEGTSNRAMRFDVAPGGRLYQRTPPAILAEGRWKGVSPPRVPGFDFPPSGWRGDIYFGPDGSRWFLGNTDKNTKAERAAFVRRDADGWTLVKVPLPRPNMRSWPGISEVKMTEDGLVVRRGFNFLQRYDGQRWRTLTRPSRRMTALLVGGDDTVWVESFGGEGQSRFHRLDADGEGWTIHEAGVMHPLGSPWSGERSASAAGPDGSVWYVPGDGDRETGRCDGVARFDGTATTRFLRDRCVYDLTFGPGGHAWVLAGDWKGSPWDPDEVGPLEVFVVTA